MFHIIDSIHKSLESRNYYGSLALAFSLPDIGTNVEYGRSTRDNKIRYTNFSNAFIKSIVPSKLTANDFYGLRCAYLHNGEYNIDRPEVIQRVQFTEPFGINCMMDNNMFGSDTKQFQVDIFCINIINDMHKWYSELISSKRLIIDNMPIITKLM